MDIMYNRTISLLWIYMLLSALDNISQSYVQGLQTLDKYIFGPKAKGTVKTIEAIEVGDIIDCVDFWKQPAFEDPLIKEAALNNPLIKDLKSWTKYGKCPKGTVPIRRTTDNGTFHRKVDDPNIHEYATVEHLGNAHGGIASFSLWKPRVGAKTEFSLSQMWAISGHGAHMNTVEAGWMVYPKLFSDAKTRLFIYWTVDGYNETGCYNQRCNDFIHLDEQIALGSAFERISVYDRLSAAAVIGLSRNEVGDWFLQLDDKLVGYYPRQKFTTLADGADAIAFGGEILKLQLSGRHTSTAMGSGYFSREGYKKASFVAAISVKNDKFKWVEPDLEVQDITRPECYDLTFGPRGEKLGHHFYFGGPGGVPPRCL